MPLLKPISLEKNKNKPPEEQPNNPLHGVKLIEIIEYLVAEHGWQKLGEKTDVRLFSNRPTIKSSLKLARSTPWVRAKLESLYLTSFEKTK